MRAETNLEQALQSIVGAFRAEKSLPADPKLLEHSFDDLGLDSLDLIEILAALETAIGHEIPDTVLGTLTVETTLSGFVQQIRGEGP